MIHVRDVFSSWSVFARTPVRSLTLALSLAAAVTTSACKHDSSTGPSSTPAALQLRTGNGQTGAVGSALTIPLAVLVVDSKGKTVSGARVDWDVGVGAGSTSPTTSTSNGDGIATTVWTLGSLTGTVRVSAQINGVTPVVFTATATAAAAASVVSTPDRAYIGVGDTIRIRAAVRDQFGNDLAGQTINFSTPDAAVATVSTSGLVSALTQGTARIIADAGGKADTVPVTVGAAGASVCGPLASRTLTLGEAFTPDADAAGARTCLTAPVGVNAEYALTLVSSDASYSAISPVDVYTYGNTTPVTALLVGNTAPSASLTRSLNNDVVPATTSISAPVSDAPRLAELARRTMERVELAPLVSDARTWHAERTARREQAARDGIAAALADYKVGDAITLNANANQACASASNRASRVAAVGTRSIVVADNENPTGGYTDAEYASIAATFDTLVYPIDTTAFGAPSNVSGNGKIILFFTRSVNSLTPPNTSSYTIGGFFFARDLYPKTARNGLAACPTSNEAEMFYLLVPDPNGTVNNNKRTKDEVTTLNLGTIAHEFQHLINSGRRLYVNTSATPNEETWLDEGLAHTAEELLYYRMSGLTSRQNIGLSLLAQSVGTFNNYASQNFARFYLYLVNPEVSSPYAPNDSLNTRGAIWNFLRFSAGRQGASGESGFYRTLVNSTTAGRTNLANALGGSAALADYLRDWTVSLIADDFSTAETALLDPRYIMPSWNFRSVYPNLRVSGNSTLGVYPINARTMLSGTTQRITLAGGTSSYVRFGIASGKSAIVNLASNGNALPSTLRYAVVRLR